MGWQVASARANESVFAAPLIDKLRARGLPVETVAMDKGYDIERVYAEARPAPARSSRSA